MSTAFIVGVSTAAVWLIVGVFIGAMWAKP